MFWRSNFGRLPESLLGQFWEHFGRLLGGILETFGGPPDLVIFVIPPEAIDFCTRFRYFWSPFPDVDFNVCLLIFRVAGGLFWSPVDNF